MKINKELLDKIDTLIHKRKKIYDLYNGVLLNRTVMEIGPHNLSLGDIGVNKKDVLAIINGNGGPEKFIEMCQPLWYKGE